MLADKLEWIESWRFKLAYGLTAEEMNDLRKEVKIKIPDAWKILNDSEKVDHEIQLNLNDILYMFICCTENFSQKVMNKKISKLIKLLFYGVEIDFKNERKEELLKFFEALYIYKPRNSIELYSGLKFKSFTYNEEKYHILLSAYKIYKNFYHRTTLINKNDAVKFLHDRGYPLRREVKGLTQSLIDMIYDKNTPSSKQNMHSDNGNKKMIKRKHGAISAKEAGKRLGVSERTVRKWDAGENRPDGYLGRDNALNFEFFLSKWLSKKKFEAMAREMNRASSGGGLADDILAQRDGDKNMN